MSCGWMSQWGIQRGNYKSIAPPPPPQSNRTGGPWGPQTVHPDYHYLRECYRKITWFLAFSLWWGLSRDRELLCRGGFRWANHNGNTAGGLKVVGGGLNGRRSRASFDTCLFPSFASWRDALTLLPSWPLSESMADTLMVCLKAVHQGSKHRGPVKCNQCSLLSKAALQFTWDTSAGQRQGHGRRCAQGMCRHTETLIILLKSYIWQSNTLPGNLLYHFLFNN